MSGLYQDAFVEGLRVGLLPELRRWGLGSNSELRLLNLSENATFLAKDPDKPAPLIFRVHRPGYHTAAEIASELDWMNALRLAETAEIPVPIPQLDGTRIGQFEHDGFVRHVVAFDLLPGEEPAPESDLTEGFTKLGEISAGLHGHARRWSPPDGFTRKTWDWEAAFGESPLWGDWREADGLDEKGRKLLERLADVLKQRVDLYGRGGDRFGLVHADLRLANLLVDGAQMAVIDFDDCGFSWFVYDFAAAISFIELQPGIPDLVASWVGGYRRVGSLGDEHVEMIPTFVLFRRLLLTAWVASHAETETAQWAGLGRFTAGTIELAERYLSNGAEEMIAAIAPMG